MFGLGEQIDPESAHETVYGDGASEHKGSFTHELIAAAAAFEAMRAYEKKQEAEGKDPKHGFTKEVAAAFTAAEVDKLVETHGLDWLDGDKAKGMATEQATSMFSSKWGL